MALSFYHASLAICRYPYTLLGGAGTVGVNCFSQERNILTQPGFEPRPLDQESTALTNSPLQLRIVTSIYHLSKRHVRSQKENVQSKLFCVRFVNFLLKFDERAIPLLTLGLSEISS